MKKVYQLFFLLIVLINCLCIFKQNNIQNEAINEDTMHEINQDVAGNENYKKAEFEFASSENYQFFKYDITTFPSSKILAFRFDFDVFAFTNFQVLCTSVESSTSDSQLISILKTLTPETSSCKEGYQSYAIHDGIVKLDEKKTKLGIALYSESFAFSGRINLRITERVLGTDESKPMEDESYSLVPFTIDIQKFRDLPKSKILFYSYSRVLQMYHAESDTPYPEQLFSGNVLSVYTNPNMVRQKYHNAMIMTLLVNPMGFANLGEEFKFEVKLFESNYLLDYYVSSNSEGRPDNSPLLINMTECTRIYYVILNYNKAEGSKTLVMDQIYGKMTYLSVATSFTQSTWDEMLDKDMTAIDLN